MSCILEISVKGKRGDRVELLPAEKLDERGKIDQMAKNWNMIDVSCTYILSGDPEGETWRQEFSYVGGRYVLVKGAAPADEAAFADGTESADQAAFAGETGSADEAALADGADTAGRARRGGQRHNASGPAGILHRVGQPGNRKLLV